MQAASESGASQGLVYFAFDLLHLDGHDLRKLPLLEGKARLAELPKAKPPGVRYSEHLIEPGPQCSRVHAAWAQKGSSQSALTSPYVSGDRGIWVKTKCLNR